MYKKHRFGHCMLRAFVVSVFAIAIYVQPSLAASRAYVVENVNDSGAGSLRQAILDANAHPGFDTITFRIASEPNSGGLHVIVLNELLPPITQGVIIDGTSQPGYASQKGPAIEISGAQIDKACAGVESGVYRDHPGLDIVNNALGDASGTTIQGLKVSHFCQGISISASLDKPAIGCLDAPATKMRISRVTVQDSAIEDNLNGNAAVDLCFSNNSVVRNNKFLRNGDHIEVTLSQTIIIEGNEGSESQDGMELVRSQRILVKNNHFSNSRRNGIVSVYEASNSIFLNNEVTNVGAMGLTLSNGNTATGNTITGAKWFGIHIRGGSNNIVKSNLVKDNGLGGIVVGAGTFLYLAECSVQSDGNPTNCGVRASLVDLGVEGDGFNNIIQNNEIIFNRGPGILVGGKFTDENGAVRITTRTHLSRNVIYGNEGLGIDLSDETQSVFFAAEEPIIGAFGEIVLAKPNGPTPDNSGLTTNEGQNFPTLMSALVSRHQLVVKGLIGVTSTRTATIEFFANPMPTPGGDPSGFGEGAMPLGQIRTHGRGQFTAILKAVPEGRLVTATATDANGNTSEFAQNISVSASPR